MFGCLITLLTAVLLAGGQPVDITARAALLGDGTLGFTYEVRDGVTGNGRGVRIRLGAGSSASYFQGYYDDDDLLVEGPAHVTVRVREGRVADLDVVVAGNDRGVRDADVDLGEVPSPAAARWFAGLVASADADVADKALLGAVIARDADVTRPLLAVVRDRERPDDVRSSTLHWLCVLAGERMLEDVNGVIDDDTEHAEVREHAVFALAQLGERTALPRLMDIARHHRDPRVRRAALFGMTRFEDSREVVALLEEILTE
jgi:hypothetical protein